MAKLIFLSNRPGTCAIVDAEDWERLHDFTWRIGAKGRVVRTIGHNETSMLAREVVQFKRYDTRIVKHRNGNFLDCRKENLEVTTKHERPPYTGMSDEAKYQRRMERRRAEMEAEGLTWNSPLLGDPDLESGEKSCP